MQNRNERNFHIFYQLIAGMDADTKNQFGLINPEYFNYLNQNETYTVFTMVNPKRLINLFFNLNRSLFIKYCLSCFQVDGTDDKAEYKDTMDAMATMGMDNDEQSDVIQVVTGKAIKHIISETNDELRAPRIVARLKVCCILET